MTTTEDAGAALDGDATRRWECSVVDCMALHLNFWEVWCNFDAQAPRYGLSLIAWDDDEPDPEPLEWRPCASYEEAIERVIALNEALIAEHRECVRRNRAAAEGAGA